jgi:hypothetical protein
MLFSWGNLIVGIGLCFLLYGLPVWQFWPVILLFWYRDPIITWLDFKIHFLRMRFRR